MLFRSISYEVAENMLLIYKARPILSIDHNELGIDKVRDSYEFVKFKNGEIFKTESLKSLEVINNENIKNRNSKGSNGKSKKKEEKNINQKGFVKFEDGFEEMSYFEDDTMFYTVKEMLIILN